MNVGEKMSGHVVFESLVWASDGDVYENSIDELRDKPLDVARLFYVYLRTHLHQEDHVEVFWNHFTNRIAVDVETTAGRKFETEFSPEPMARVDLVQRVVQFTELVRSIVDE